MIECSIERALVFFGEKWKFLIVRELLKGTLRFSELKRNIQNISQKVLTQNLRQMEASGLITRKVYPEVPPKVEYSLTELGLSLKPIMDAIRTWGDTYAKA